MPDAAGLVQAAVTGRKDPLDIAAANMTGDVLLVCIAREIAIDHYTPEEISERYKLGEEQWQRIINSPRFKELVHQEIVSWQSATNTSERTKLKAAAMLEEWLPEAFTRMHDAAETLSAKTELAKLVARLAGAGMNDLATANAGEKFTVNINLGADNQIKFEKTVTTKVIDADAIN